MKLRLLLAGALLSPLAMGAPLSGPVFTPVTLRECSLEAIPPAIITPFTSWLYNQPPATIPLNMGSALYRTTFNGTCIQARVYNWSCDHVLNVTGPGVANAVGSIAEQCDGFKYSTGETAGPTGFGYYKDLETGNEYTQHLWVVSGGCTDRHRQSACSPGA